MRKHLALGWWWVALFLALGLGLEVLHGVKAGFYLDVSNETRRLMWTLAHAHGTLLGVLHLAFAFTLGTLAAGEAPWARRASLALTLAGVLLPGGFLLGGLFVWGGDPFLGVLLVPLGAVALFAAAVGVARRSRA